jgi:hypothetical protein
MAKWGWGVFVGVTAASAGCLDALRPAQAPDELDAFRQRLRSFQTLWARFEWPPPQGRSAHLDAPAGVLRIERATGRVSIDTGSLRVLWDGVHLWRDTRDDLPAERMGDEADARMAALVEEVLKGLPHTELLPPGPGEAGWRLDLPFDGDDDHAILLSGLGSGQTGSLILHVVQKDTQRPAVAWDIPLVLSLSLSWDVRLLNDLTEPESLSSRGTTIAVDGWQEVWVGPGLFPGFHVQSTQNPLQFDVSSSAGWPAPSGQEVPQARLQDVTCQKAGEVVSAPLSLSFVLDPTAPSVSYLPGALAAGCPLSLEVEAVFTQEPAAGASTRVQGTLLLRDTSTLPPTVLAQRAFEDVAAAPQAWRRREAYELASLPTGFSHETLELQFEGVVEVRCQAKGAGASTVSFGTEPERPPMLAWSGCYPELGVVP